MEKLVCLLRGINIGGRNKINMKALKSSFERAGFSEVETYINTGNIIFESTLDKAAVTEIIAQFIFDDFGFKIDVLVLTKSEFMVIAQATPQHFTNDTQMKTDILFLWSDYDRSDVLSELPLKPDIDKVTYVKGALIWNIDRADQPKSGLHKIAGTKFYANATVRNVNTLRNLENLLKT